MNPVKLGTETEMIEYRYTEIQTETSVNLDVHCGDRYIHAHAHPHQCLASK